MNAGWPLELLTTITYSELKNKTSVGVEWIPVNATPDEIRTFDSERDGMNTGWRGNFDRLDEYLGSLSKA